MTDATQTRHGGPTARSPFSRLTRLATPRRAYFSTAVGMIGGAMALNWGWLAAVGAAQ